MEDQEQIQDDQQRVSVKDAAVKYGLLLGVILIIYGMILQFTDMSANKYLGYVNYVFAIAFIILAQNWYKQNGDGYMKFGTGLGIGTLTSAIAAFISTVFSYVYIKFVDDSMLDMIRLMQEEELMKRGMSQEQIDQALEMTGFMMKPEILMAMGFVAMVFFCFILSLLVTLFTKKEDTSQI
ncbi:MAG: DUF4199 domain-containing protein [Cyclobacteriaceae bacterium]|nr:DUF4199 domain-containing protein [Cyclobacteriaceae bacterium]